MSLYDALKQAEHPSTVLSAHLTAALNEKRQLASCVFELTPVCNFRCPFCYARISPDELKRQGKTLLPKQVWKDYIDQLAAMDCWQLTLTGGECTVYPDFFELYEYAYNKGMVMTVMTNGSCITDEHIRLFRRMPPERIFITLYGASPETYQTVCGNAAYFETVRTNLERLLENRLPVVAQFTAGECNVRDMEAIYLYTKSLGIHLRYSEELVQYGQCTAKTLEETHANSELFQQMAERIRQNTIGITPEEYAAMRREQKRYPNLADNIPKKGIGCAAGRSSCFIRWDGTVRPCVSWDAFCLKLDDHSIEQAWKQLVEWADNVPRLEACVGCLHRSHCVPCPAAHYNDTKQLGVPSPRLCWKVTHPQQAADAEAFYAAHGYLLAKDT